MFSQKDLLVYCLRREKPEQYSYTIDSLPIGLESHSHSSLIMLVKWSVSIYIDSCGLYENTLRGTLIHHNIVSAV